MRHTDIAIVGGGMAGSTAAAMLARRGLDAILIDAHSAYPPDFRCEKLDQSQLALLHKTGVGEGLLVAATASDKIWIARRGRIVEKRVNHQIDAAYNTMVSAMRGMVGGSVSTIVGRCTAISASANRQVVTLSGGEEISARLVVLANGLNSGLRQGLGLQRQDISPAHSIAIGFDIAPRERPQFDFRALTYYPERVGDGIAYLSLFPIDSCTRANLFLYRDLRDPWLKTLRDTPVATLLEVMPGLAPTTGPFAVTSFVHVRPSDLYVTTGAEQAGVVLIGDAFATSCPAAGTGLNKVLTDVERLVNHHLPCWLATPGMGRDKIAAFYADPIKRAADAWSAERAIRVRGISTDQTLAGRTRREVRHVGHIGRALLRALRWRGGRVAVRPSRT